MPSIKAAWEGGYVTKDRRGRDTYYIRKQIAGVRYDVSTRCHTLKGAMEQLKRFEADPEGYAPTAASAGSSTKGPVFLDEALALEFLTWSRDVQKNTPRWVNEQRNYLAWWADQLRGRNLRRISLTEHILPALEGAKARGPRIAVLKRLYSYLRKVKHVLELDEDPTFQRLAVPQSRPEQWKRVKAIPRENLELARQHLTDTYRDGLDVLAGTGWHVTELVRFVRDGATEAPPPQGQAGASEVAGVLVCPQTKGGNMLRVAVSATVLGAGQRLLERGEFSRKNFALALKDACRTAGIPLFTPGQMRHSIATYAINNGADMAAVASFLNHKSPRTTARYYATHATPAKIPTPL